MEVLQVGTVHRDELDGDKMHKVSTHAVDRPQTHDAAATREGGQCRAWLHLEEGCTGEAFLISASDNKAGSRGIVSEKWESVYVDPKCSAEVFDDDHGWLQDDEVFKGGDEGRCHNLPSDLEHDVKRVHVFPDVATPDSGTMCSVILYHKSKCAAEGRHEAFAESDNGKAFENKDWASVSVGHNCKVKVFDDDLGTFQQHQVFEGPSSGNKCFDFEDDLKSDVKKIEVVKQSDTFSGEGVDKGGGPRTRPVCLTSAAVLFAWLHSIARAALWP